MPADRVKATTVRLPAELRRRAGRGAGWTATVDLAVEGGWSALSCDAATESDARRDLTALVTAALARMRHRPVLVIGGDGQYADHLHVINPEPYGWVVHVVRDGRVTATWHGDHGRDELLRQVLDHVGGQPSVVAL